MLGCVFRPLTRTPVVLPVPRTADRLRVWRWDEVLAWQLAWVLACWLASSVSLGSVDLFRLPGGRPRLRPDTWLADWLVGWLAGLRADRALGWLLAPMASRAGRACVVFSGLPRRAVAILGSRMRRYGSRELDSRSRHRGWTPHLAKGVPAPILE